MVKTRLLPNPNDSALEIPSRTFLTREDVPDGRLRGLSLKRPEGRPLVLRLHWGCRASPRGKGVGLLTTGTDPYGHSWSRSSDATASEGSPVRI